jgi:hypothetical protein
MAQRKRHGPRRLVSIAASTKASALKIKRESEMAEATSATPTTTKSSTLVNFLREAPFILLVVLGLIGISWTSLSRTPATTYWVVLTPIAALICIAEGWSRYGSNAERLRMVVAQLLHWAAVLAAMVLIRVSDVHGMLNADASGLVLLTLLALGVFTAGLNLRSWRLCLTGAFLAVAAPILAWVEQAALLILLLIGGALIAIGIYNWWIRGRRPSLATQA